MHADRRTPVVLLAVLYSLSGALCLAAAVWPLHPNSPVALKLAVGDRRAGRRDGLLRCSASGPAGGRSTRRSPSAAC